MSEITDKSQADAIKDFQTSMLEAGAALRAKYVDVPAEKTFTSEQLYPELDRWVKFSTFGNTLPSLTGPVFDAFYQASNELLAARAYVKEHPGLRFTADSNFMKEWTKAALTCLAIFIPVGVDVLQKQAAADSVIRKVKNAPADLAKWSLAKVLEILGLPPWLPPALVYTVLAGLGLIAYLKFLHPTVAAAIRGKSHA